MVTGKRNDGGSATFSMQSSVMVNYHQAKLAVNTVFLQGVRTAQDVDPLQLKHIYQAGESRSWCAVERFTMPSTLFLP